MKTKPNSAYQIGNSNICSFSLQIWTGGKIEHNLDKILASSQIVTKEIKHIYFKKAGKLSRASTQAAMFFGRYVLFHQHMLNLSFCPKTCNGQNKEIKSLKINQLLSSSHTSRKSRESQLLSAKLVDAIPLGTVRHRNSHQHYQQHHCFNALVPNGSHH